MLTSIARPYAEAAFRFAKQSQAIESWQEFLHAFSSLLKDKQLLETLNNPLLEQTKIVDALLADIGNKLEPTQQNFLRVLAENRRLSTLADVATLFNALCDKESNIASVEIKTAFPLDEATQKKLEAALETRLKKNIRMETTMDDSLLGGLQIRVGDHLLDASVKGQLKQLIQDLSRGL